MSASQGDRALVRLALIEGDATTAMLQWAAQNLSQEQLAEVGSWLTPADQVLLDSMPAIAGVSWSSRTSMDRCSSARSWGRAAGMS